MLEVLINRILLGVSGVLLLWTAFASFEAWSAKRKVDKLTERAAAAEARAEGLTKGLEVLEELQINATVRGETLLRNVTDVTNAPRTDYCANSVIPVKTGIQGV